MHQNFCEKHDFKFFNSRSVPQQQLLDGHQRGDIGKCCWPCWYFSNVICMKQGPTSNLPAYLFFCFRVYLPLCVFSKSPAATYGLILCLLSLSSVFVSVEKLQLIVDEKIPPTNVAEK